MNRRQMSLLKQRLEQLQQDARALADDSSVQVQRLEAAAPRYPRPEHLRGGIYWPRLSPNPDFWHELDKGAIDLADIRADLLQLAALGVNTLRVRVFYNRVYEAFGDLGFSDGQGTINAAKFAQVGEVFTLMREAGMSLIVQTDFGLEGGLSDAQIARLSDPEERAHHKAYLTALLNVLEAHSDHTAALFLFNEADGYGAWDDEAKALALLDWLGELKAFVKDAAPELPVILNGVTHVTYAQRWPGAALGEQSLLELSDWAVFNSFYWADNGYWPYTIVRRQLQYVAAANLRDKPLLILECGWPASYDGMEVAGDTDPETGETLSEDRASLAPVNGQFDRPRGLRPMTPHTPEMQRRAVAEAVYWAERADTIGVLVWSLYDHKSKDGSYAYPDPFGLIDRDGQPRPAVAALARAFTEQADATGEAAVSLVSGEGGHVNGLQGYDPADAPAGVFLSGESLPRWTSEPLPYWTPLRLRLRFEQLGEPEGGGPKVGMVLNDRLLEFIFEDWEDRWRVFVDGQEVARSAPLQSLGLEVNAVTFELLSNTVGFRHNGEHVDFFAFREGSLTSDPYAPSFAGEAFNGALKLTAQPGVSGVGVRLLEAHALAEPFGRLALHPKYA